MFMKAKKVKRKQNQRQKRKKELLKHQKKIKKEKDLIFHDRPPLQHPHELVQDHRLDEQLLVFRGRLFDLLGCDGRLLRLILG